jgi:hypothetical protein
MRRGLTLFELPCVYVRRGLYPMDWTGEPAGVIEGGE